MSPILVFLFILIRMESRGSPLYAQRRVGLRGRPFSMFKLRSMVRDADQKGALLTVGRDARITRVGRVLRATKLDELPQLWNVLRGDMSLVGPRPEVARYVDLYTLEQRRVLDVRPGITDPASFAMFNESEMLARVSDVHSFYVSRLMPEKIRINLEYAARATLATDLMLILATVGKIFGIRVDVLKRLKILPPELGL